MEVTRRPMRPVFAGQDVTFRFELETWEHPDDPDYDFRILDSQDNHVSFDGSIDGVATHHMEHDHAFKPTATFAHPGDYEVQTRAHLGDGKFGDWKTIDRFTVEPAHADVLRVALEPNGQPNSTHQDLWKFIGEVAEGLRYNHFAFYAKHHAKRFGKDPRYGSMTYDSLHRLSKKFVTDTALGHTYGPPTSESPVWTTEALRGSAIDKSYVKKQQAQTKTAPFPDDISGPYPTELVPFVELIYVYWLEEAMLFQSLNRILARFQNRRSPGGRDSLSRLAVSPLLPLRGLLWGLAESEKDRLSLRRRAAEYEYQYGLQLIGRAVPPAEHLVERRTQFLEAFHSLLNACHHFYRENSDKTVEADAFPLLSNLRELHLVLAQGANNQFADASVTARIETLEVQWMLAQPEMQEFLGSRTMIPYDEDWMGRIDTMKSMQGWADTSVTHFYDLAVHGEQLLLSVRHGSWNVSGVAGMSENDAKNWAIAWKQSVQRYIHAYRAVTGVDLSERVDTTMPSTLLQRRLSQKLVGF